MLSCKKCLKTWESMDTQMDLDAFSLAQTRIGKEVVLRIESWECLFIIGKDMSRSNEVMTRCSPVSNVPFLSASSVLYSCSCLAAGPATVPVKQSRCSVSVACVLFFHYSLCKGTHIFWQENYKTLKQKHLVWLQFLFFQNMHTLDTFGLAKLHRY